MKNKIFFWYHFLKFIIRINFFKFYLSEWDIKGILYPIFFKKGLKESIDMDQNNFILHVSLDSAVQNQDSNSLSLFKIWKTKSFSDIIFLRLLTDSNFLYLIYRNETQKAFYPRHFSKKVLRKHQILHKNILCFNHSLNFAVRNQDNNFLMYIL